MSERKAHNPRSFCRTYTMDKQLINTGEQKDMTEFFTDLISKLEDMSPSLVSISQSKLVLWVDLWSIPDTEVIVDLIKVAYLLQTETFGQGVVLWSHYKQCSVFGMYIHKIISC